jgi:hypothetical protein
MNQRVTPEVFHRELDLTQNPSFEWLPLLTRLSATLRDPAGLPPTLADAITDLNGKVAKAREARRGYESMTEAAFHQAEADDHATDAETIVDGTYQSPATSAATFAARRRQAHAEAAAWTNAANAAAAECTNIMSMTPAHTAALVDEVRAGAPDVTAAIKTATAALAKLRPAIEAADRADALTAWITGSAGRSVVEFGQRRQPQPGDVGPKAELLQQLLAMLEGL